MAAEKLERIYTVNLTGAFKSPRTKRTPKAVEILREFIARHMKARGGKVVLSNAVNAAVWARSIQKPLRKIKVRAVKENDVTTVSLIDEKPAKQKFAFKKRASPSERKQKGGSKKAEKPAEPKKADKPAAAPAEKKEPAKAAAQKADAKQAAKK